MKKMLSVAEWHQMALEGTAPVMRIMLEGCSMDPLIRIRKDYVSIIQAKAPFKAGNIVLFADPNKAERYVVHRIWRTKDDSVLTWGDNCPKPDGWIPAGNVWGKVVLIERGERRIKPHPKTGLIWAWIWHQAMKIYRLREKIRGKHNKGQ